jgi:hypothetical protein
VSEEYVPIDIDQRGFSSVREFNMAPGWWAGVAKMPRAGRITLFKGEQPEYAWNFTSIDLAEDQLMRSSVHAVGISRELPHNIWDLYCEKSWKWNEAEGGWVERDLKKARAIQHAEWGNLEYTIWQNQPPPSWSIAWHESHPGRWHAMGLGHGEGSGSRMYTPLPEQYRGSTPSTGLREMMDALQRLRDSSREAAEAVRRFEENWNTRNLRNPSQDGRHQPG